MALASKTFNSSNYVGKDGRNLALTVSQESNNSAANTSVIKWTLSTTGGDVPYYDTYCLIKINGKQVYFSNGTLTAGGYSGWITSNNGGPTGIWYDANGNEYTCAKWGFTTSGTETISHNNDGTKSINITFLVGVFYYKVSDCGGSLTFASTDRTAPTITQNSPTNIVYNGCTISASSNVNCSKWWYRQKLYTSGTWGGWTEINSSGSSKSANITGLSPNTEYNFQWCGKKASNGVEGYSGTSYVKTLGASILNSVGNIYLDVDNPILTYNLTSYSNTFYHRLVLQKDSSNTITIDIGTKSSGGYTYTFTTTQVNTLLGWLGSTSFESSFSLTATLYTYTSNTYSSQIGSSSVISNAIKLLIRRENAKPTLSVGGYEVTSGIVESNNQLVVPNSSVIRINNINAVVKYGAAITSLVAISTNDNVTKTIASSGNSYNNNYSFGTTSSQSANFIEIVLTDSRGEIVKIPILLQIYRKGAIVSISDYNSWYDILYSHYNAGYYSEGNYIYYISGTTSTNFSLPSKKVSGNIVEADDLNADTNSIKSHINYIKTQVGDAGNYYNSVSTNLTNAAAAANDIASGDIISAMTKTNLDTNLLAVNQIVLFNLVKG